MSTYKKPHLTFEQQLELLTSRGLEVTDTAAALEYLRRIGYYRLSGYLYPFRQLTTKAQCKDEFIPGAKFQDAVELYVFDKKLRLIVLDAIERIEVAVRVDIAYLLGQKDLFAQTRADLLHPNFLKHTAWINKQNQRIERSKEEFVQHYKNKYGEPFPIWMAIELWDFGLLSTFYQGMTFKDKMLIAEKYSIPRCDLMESWLRCLNHARNIAAHHSRLWNKNLVDRPKFPKIGEIEAFNSLFGNTQVISRVYGVLCILAHFMKHICPRSSWATRLYQLIRSFPEIDSIIIYDMGFPDNWEKHVFWEK
jgi:abortive infection bacteriophage resistance protein